MDKDSLEEYSRGWSITDALPVHSVGIATARDHLTIRWSSNDLWETVRDFARLDAEEAREKYRLRTDVQDWKVRSAQEDVRSTGPSEGRITRVLYRPMDRRWTYYTGNSRGFICRPRADVMGHMLGGPNIALITSRLTKGENYQHAQVTRDIVEVICMSPNTSNNGFVFPVYLYPRGESLFDEIEWPGGPGGRVPNLRPAFVSAMGERLGLTFVSDGVGDLAATFGPEDVFHYIYAVFHAPTYRERYAEFLKIDFPRVPLTSNLDLFRALCGLGADLVALHLLEDEYPHASWNRGGSAAPVSEALTLPSPGGRGTETPMNPLAHLITTYPVAGDNTVEKGHPKYAANGRVYISKDDARAGTQGQYFDGVPPEAWAFHVGGYQVCAKWLKDRVGRQLTFDDLTHYQRVVVALRETIRLMGEVDAAIEGHGGWPME